MRKKSYAPAADAILPASHRLHCVAVRAADPGEQGSHSELDAFDIYPVEHTLHSEAPAAPANLPASESGVRLGLGSCRLRIRIGIGIRIRISVGVNVRVGVGVKMIGLWSGFGHDSVIANDSPSWLSAAGRVA